MIETANSDNMCGGAAPPRLISWCPVSSEQSVGTTGLCEHRNEGYPNVPEYFTITEKVFSWFNAPTSAFTFKTPLRHYAKQALTPRSLNVKLGPRRKGHKGRAVWLA